MRTPDVPLVALANVLIATCVGAATYNLPDLGLEPGGMGTTDLIVDDAETNGEPHAGLSVIIRFDPTVATPATATLGAGAPGHMIGQNVLTDTPVVGTNELRVIVSAFPVATFLPGRQTIFRIPWTAVGSVGDSTPLAFSGDEAANDAQGTVVAANFVGGTIYIVDVPDPIDEMPTVENFENWVAVQLLPFPFSDPFDSDYMDLVPNVPHGSPAPGGTTSLSAVTTADSLRDGVAGWASPVDGWGWTANSTYRVDWTIAGTVAGEPAGEVNLSRFRARDNANNTFVELILGPSGVASLDGAGTPFTYSQFYEPSDLTDNIGNVGQVGAVTGPLDGLRLDWDVVDFEDNRAGTTILSNLDIVRFSRAEIDAVFTTAFTVTDFTDDSQWTESLFGDTGDGDPEGEIVIPPPAIGLPYHVEINNISYTADPMGVTIGTELNCPTSSTGSGVVSIGQFSEFGIVAGNVAAQGGQVYRQVLAMTDPDGAGGAMETAAEVRLRLTDASQRISATHFIEPVENRDLIPGNEAAGDNRPPSGSSAEYRNYLAYPAGADIQDLIDRELGDILGLTALIDFNCVDNEGDLRITAAAIETAPANALLP